ncbi:MAG: hypothetical protein QN178_16855 [Armatimonadota bacterium]|nr:hypothetical protein [Armatimonadota bacterium]
MSRWLHIWQWADDEARRVEAERDARLREAAARSGIDLADILGDADREEELLERLDANATQP